MGSRRGRTGPAVGLPGIGRVWALIIMAGLARPALAAGEEAETAPIHLRRAAAASDLGNFADAAREYEAAYMKAWDPNLLVHVGQAWQRAGDRQKALTAFHSYVRVAPGGEHRALCEAKIHELEGQPSGPAMAVPLPGPMGPPMMAAPPPNLAPPGPPPAPPAPPVVAPVLPPPPAYAPAPAPATTFATSEARPPATAESPVYHRWPFWIVAGTVVVAGAAIAIWYTRDQDLAMPTTTFGAKQF